jgi:C1A family cysteine protease
MGKKTKVLQTRNFSTTRNDDERACMHLSQGSSISGTTKVMDELSAALGTERHFLSRRALVKGAAALATGVTTQSLFIGEASADSFTTPINCLTPVKNQNSCNACTAFAVVAAIEATYNRKNGVSADPLNLSEGQLFFAAGPKAACEATHWWPEDALRYCRDVGLTRENNDKFVDDKNKLVKITKAQRLIGSKLKDTQDAMETWIKNIGPVIAVMAEYSDFFPFAGNTVAYKPGVTYPGSPSGKPWLVGGHVMAIVGYDNTSKYWICKNSYGIRWNSAYPLSLGAGYVNVAYGTNSANDDDALIDQIDVWGVSFDPL